MDQKQMLDAANKICGYYENLKENIRIEDIGLLAKDVLDSDIHVLDNKGRLISYTSETSTCALNDEAAAQRVAVRLSKIPDGSVTVAQNGSCPFNEGNCTFTQRIHVVAPLVYASKRIGTLICTRDGNEQDELYQALCKLLATLCAMAVYNCINDDEISRKHRKESAEHVAASLSYTEKEAARAILNAIPNTPPKISEGLINASVISKEAGITRSVIASAMKKLEGAGIISIRSLGMKGTHITILNPDIYQAI